MQTLNVTIEEMLIMSLLLGQFIDQQNRDLRSAKTPGEAESARARLEVATRLRGKLPLDLQFGAAKDEEL